MERRHWGVLTRSYRPRARNLFGRIRWCPRRFRWNGYNRPCMECHVRVSLSPCSDHFSSIFKGDRRQCIALLQGHTALVCQLQLCPTTGLLATGGSDGRVITFDLHNYTSLQRISAHDSSVTSLQFDSNFLITGGNDGRVRMYERQSGASVRDLTERCDSVWKVACKGGTCAIMCKRSGKMVIEIWTFRQRTTHL